ncbi:MAG: hypothetical protein ACI89X_004674 [Planctomycetota bacterium]|jgi:hypothetical protein
MKASLIPVLITSCLILATSLSAQGDKQEPKKLDPQAVLKEVMASFKKQGIKLDPKARTVTIPAVVNRPQDPMEYLLIHRRGKKHESVFITESKPSILNAALMMIGLEKGRNATFVEKKPSPTLEEVQNGADPLIVTPPKGKRYYMTVRWTTPEKQVVEYCVEDLLFELSTQEPMGRCEWIYLGGRMGQLYKNDPEVYIADLEGNLISICYLSPDNHLGTMSHERARDDQNWWTTTKVPEPGTAVEFIFHAIEPALYVEREKRMLAAEKKAKAEAAKKKAGAAAKEVSKGKAK